MPEPTIIIDTREQEPYEFEALESEVRKLDTGDYSLAGREGDICIERKSLDDFVNTITRHRKRFYKEIDRMTKMTSAIILVEATLQDILEQRYTSDMPYYAILGSTHGIMLRHGIPTVFAGDRPCAARYVETFLKKAHKQFEKEAEYDS